MKWGGGHFLINAKLSNLMTEADLRKRALSAVHDGGHLVAQNFHFGGPKINFSGFKKVNSKKESMSMLLGLFDLLACKQLNTSLFEVFLALWVIPAGVTERGQAN